MANIKIKYEVDDKALAESEKKAKKLKDTIKGTADEEKRLEDNSDAASSSVTDLAGAAGLANTRLGAMATGLGASARSMATAAKSANLLKIALIALPIFALIAAFTALTQWFSRTEKGAERLKVITAATSQVFQTILDIVSKVGEAIYNAFSNPQQAAKDLGNAIKTFVSDRVEFLSKGVGQLGEAFRLLFAGEFKAAAKAAGDGFADLNRGLNPAFIAGEALVEFVKDTVKEIKSDVEGAIALQERENTLIRNRRDFLVEEAKLQAEINELRNIASDQTSTDQERLEADLKAEGLINQLFNKRINLAREEFEIKQARNALSDSTIEDLEEEARLQANVIQLEADRQQQLRRITSERSGLEKRIIQEQVKLAIDESNERVRIKQEELQAIFNMERDMIDRQAKNSLDAQSQILDIERGTVDKLFDIREEELEKQLQISNLTIDQQKKINDEIIKLRKQRTDFEESQLKKEVELNIQYADQIIQAKRGYVDEEINIIKEQAIKGEITKKEANERLIALERQTREEIFDVTQQALQRLLESEDLTAKQREEIEKRLAQARVEYIDSAFDAIQESDNKMLAEVQRIFGEIAGIAQQFADLIFETEQNNIDRRLEALETQYEREIELAGDNASLKEDIEVQYTERRKQLMKQQAEADKKARLFSAIIGTATAVINALSTPPAPLGIALAAIVGALGAFQISTIASQQPPQFNKGTKRVPGSDTSRDSVHAILTPGEGVMPVDRMNDYRPAFDAIFDRKIKPEIINDFVTRGGGTTKEYREREIIRDSTILNIDERGFFKYHKKGLSRAGRQVREYSMHG